jgi:glycosyltransferase involved in cell wall biosynthesis
VKKHVCMIVYANYFYDWRVRREAETIASLPEFTVSVLGLKEMASPRKYVLEGVNVEEMNMFKYRGKSTVKYLISYVKFTLQAFLACTRLFIRSGINIVHVHNMPNFIVFSALVPILGRKKIILDVHDTMIETYSSKFHGFINTVMEKVLRLEEKLCCALADRIICVNHIQRDVMISRGIPKDKIIISMNVPEPKRLNHRGLIRSAPDKENTFRVAYFGTITKRLGIDIAIKAIANLRKNIPRLEFSIIGDGDDLGEFISLSQNLGVDDIVCFSMKLLPFEQLLDVLSTVSLVVIPNRRNNATELMLPVKLLDSVALGIPVIVSRLKATEYYFSDDMVFYFEPDNVDSLADAIWYVYNNKAERIKKAENAKRFLEKYGWEKHKFDLINMYKSLQ